MERDLLATVLLDDTLHPLLLRWARLELAQDPQPHAFSQPGEPSPRLRAIQEQLCNHIAQHLSATYRQPAPAAKALATLATQTFYGLQNPFALRQMSLQEALGN